MIFLFRFVTQGVRVGRDDSYRAEISAPGKTSASVWVSERACVFAMYKRVCVYAQDINKKEKKNTKIIQ